MAYDNNRSFPQRPKNVLDDRRVGLSAPSSAKGKWASLNWGYFGNQARLTLWTNDPDDQSDKRNNNGKIDVKMPPTDFCKFLVLLEMAINFPDTGDHKHWMEIKDYSWFGREKSKDVEVQGTLYVGKKDGEVWMSLVSKDKNRPRIKFPFGNTMYTAFYNGNGEAMTNAETSVLVAKANLLFLKHSIPTLAIDTYKEPEKKEGGNNGGNRGGGGSYGNNRGGGNYDGGGRSGSGSNNDTPDSDGYDDDVPF
jgi:uncharacterized membrane protein YgcG